MAEEKMSRRLFVGGLFDGISEKDLSDRFSRFGEVSAVDIRSRKDNLGNILKTFAYLNMAITEKDYKKCMATFNKTTWRGNEMQIQLAKESFMDRLAREREAAKKQAMCSPVNPVVEPVNLQVKGAVPGTAVEGKEDWVVGKYGRALPVVNIRTKNKKKVLKIDPSKYVHGVKKFDHGKKAEAMETDPSPSVNGLTWQLDVEETETLKKIKGEFPQSKKITQKRKHSLSDDSIISGKAETICTRDYHSNSDSCTSDDETPQVTKKKKSAPKRDLSISEEKPTTKVQTPKTPLVNGKRKRTISDTSSPHDGRDTRSRALSPNVSIIEPRVNATPTKAQKPSAVDILKRLKVSSQKKEKDSVAAKGVSPKLSSTIKGQNLSFPVPETEKTTWSPSIDVGSAKQSVKLHTPKAMDILEKLKLASQQKQNIKDSPVVREHDKAEAVDVKNHKQSTETKTPNTADILEKLKRKQRIDDTPSSKTGADSIDDGSSKQKVKPKTLNTTDILEKLKRKQKLETTPTTTKCATSETSPGDINHPKDTGQKAKKSQIERKSQKEDVSSNSDSEDEGSLRNSKEKRKSPKVPTVLTMETEVQEKAPQKSKKTKSQKNTAAASMVKVIQFDDDIGVEADDEDDVNNRRHKPRQPLLRRNPTIAQPAFAQVGSVDEFGVGMLVDEKTRPLSEEEKKWNRYNSNSYSSDEDILDAAKAGSFTKLDRIAKLAQLGQKHIEIPGPLTCSTQLATGQKVYNSDSNSDDECFKQVQTMPKRLKEKSLPSKTENIKERKQHLPNDKSSDSGDIAILVQQQTVNKYNPSTSKKTQLETSKQIESSDESSTASSASDSGEVKISKTKGSVRKSSKESTESSAEEDSSDSRAEEAMKRSPVKKVRGSENVSITKQKAQVKKRDTSDSSSESSASSNEAKEETVEVKQKSKVLNKKGSPVVNKKGVNEENSTSSSESSRSSDEEALQVQPKVLKGKKDDNSVSKKGADNESSSESSTSSDEEALQVQPKVLKGKRDDRSLSKKGADNESSSERSTSSDEEALEVQPKVLKGKKDDRSVSKKGADNESSSESTSSDEETLEVQPKVLKGKEDNSSVSKKGADKESSSESSTSSDEETTQVKPQVVQSKKHNTSVSKKEVLKEQSSDSSTSSDEEPAQSKPAEKKQKLLQQSEGPKGEITKAPAPASQAAVKDQLSDKPKPEKPKVIKSKQAVNQQRLESLKLRNKETLAQKNLLKQALASVDANTSNSKKIIFDSDSEDEKMKMLETSSSSETDSGDDSDTESSDEESEPKPIKDTATKKPALFDDDDEESEDDAEDQFRVRPQFEGESGSKLIALQSRFGNDPRFKFTEKFLDSDNEEPAQDSGAEEEMEVTEETTVAERDRTLAILKDVVGQADSKTKKTKAVLFKDMATQQYDPTKDEHKQFEVQVEKKEKKKKKKEIPVAHEAEPLPQVSGDRYFEVQNSLKDMFTKTEDKPFSLLAMLGRAEDEPPAKGFSQQADGKGQAFKHIQSPWEQQFGSDGDSTGDESGDPEHDDTSVFKSKADNDTKKKSDGTRKGISHGFFFVDNDPRIADGIDFFRRQEDIETIREKWAKERPDLVEAYRNKRKRFRFMKKEGTTPNYKAGFKPRGGKRVGVRGRR